MKNRKKQFTRNENPLQERKDGMTYNYWLTILTLFLQTSKYYTLKNLTFLMRSKTLRDCPFYFL